MCDSLVASNQAGGNSGGLYEDSFTTLDVFNSTFSGNTAAGHGGGVRVHTRAGKVRLVNTTLAGKVEDTEPGLAGVTIYLDLNDNGQLDEGEPSYVTDTGMDVELDAPWRFDEGERWTETETGASSNPLRPDQPRGSRKSRDLDHSFHLRNREDSARSSSSFHSQHLV